MQHTWRILETNNHNNNTIHIPLEKRSNKRKGKQLPRVVKRSDLIRIERHWISDLVVVIRSNQNGRAGEHQKGDVQYSSDHCDSVALRQWLGNQIATMEAREKSDGKIRITDRMGYLYLALISSHFPGKQY